MEVIRFYEGDFGVGRDITNGNRSELTSMRVRDVLNDLVFQGPGFKPIASFFVKIVKPIN